MINTLKLCAITAFLFSWVFLQAANQVKEVTLNDGRVLVNPVVLEQEPDGLSVGHQNGVTFVRFSDMPEKIQKKYHYDPKAAKEYSQKKRKAQKRIARQDHQRKIDKQKRQVELKLSRLDSDINKLRLRIKYLNEEIERCRSKQSSNESTINQLDTRRSDRVTVSDRYYWRGGYRRVYIDNRPTMRERTNERKLRKRLKKESERTSGHLNQLQKELMKKKRELISMQNEYLKTQKFYKKNF